MHATSSVCASIVQFRIHIPFLRARCRASSGLRHRSHWSCTALACRRSRHSHCHRRFRRCLRDGHCGDRLGDGHGHLRGGHPWERRGREETECTQQQSRSEPVERCERVVHPRCSPGGGSPPMFAARPALPPCLEVGVHWSLRLADSDSSAVIETPLPMAPWCQRQQGNAERAQRIKHDQLTCADRNGRGAWCSGH